MLELWNMRQYQDMVIFLDTPGDSFPQVPPEILRIWESSQGQNICQHYFGRIIFSMFSTLEQPKFADRRSECSAAYHCHHSGRYIWLDGNKRSGTISPCILSKKSVFNYSEGIDLMRLFEWMYYWRRAWVEKKSQCFKLANKTCHSSLPGLRFKVASKHLLVHLQLLLSPLLQLQVALLYPSRYFFVLTFW